MLNLSPIYIVSNLYHQHRYWSQDYVTFKFFFGISHFLYFWKDATQKKVNSLFAVEIEQLTGIKILKKPCWLHLPKNLEWYNYKDTAPYGAAGIDVIRIISHVAQLLQESKFDKYVQGNFSSLWKLFCDDRDIKCESIIKAFGSRKIELK